MSGFSSTDNGSATLVLALGLWLVMLAPQWILLLLATKHLARLREAVARRFGWKLLAAASWIAALMLAMIGTISVCRDVLGPGRLGVQYIVVSAWFVQQILLIVAVIVAAGRHRAAGGAPAPKLRNQASANR